MNFIIIGAGIAGLTAAETLRKENPDAEIVLFSEEKQSPYYRPRLPEVVSGKVPADKIYVHPDEWFIDKKLEFRKGEKAVEICQDNNQIRGSLGSRLTYDKILLATGASAFLPEAVQNCSLGGIYPVRTLPDAWSINFAARNARRATLLGSGLLGLEIGYALTRLNVEVHVLERSTRILPNQTTSKSSAKLRAILEREGFIFHLDSEALKVEGEKNLERVILRSGEAINCDFMVVSAGIVPNLELAKSLKVKTDRAIVVDQYLETTIPNIYAAGDCAQTPDGRGGLWAIARQEGLVAGFNLAQTDPSKRKSYEPILPSSTLKVAGVELITSGNIDPADKLPMAEFETGASYRKIVTSQIGLLIGFTNLGTTKGNREMSMALGKKIISPEILKSFGNDDFNFDLLASLPDKS
ncbi:MAG: FAD-dependent oxidoreductase [Deltaproteobacteria bacterium]|jgi:nitrite reductase (NADH) large subunit|nr:FAD-dependent oxidoreductase [Deltaproteobacteria bacterium]